ncbi:MAG: response regulator transcription factor [Rhodospirillales bacterium]|jgi:FixJ family two-component response regulator|nr:response regulator transcription factor [Rhodospirillales bacterium]
MNNVQITPLVHIVDDDTLLRSAVKGLLEDEGYAVIEYESAEAFLCADIAIRPSCILLDIKMGGITGIELHKKIQDWEFLPPVIFLTGSAPLESAVKAIREGAVHFLIKPVDDCTLLDAIAEGVAKSREPSKFFAELKLLTQKEQEIAKLLRAGNISKEIARELGVSVRTVEWHRKNISEKLI